MRTPHAIAIAGTLATLAACTTPDRQVDGYSASKAEADKVVLDCRGRCGWISNEDTKWKYRGQCDTGSVVLDPGSYQIGVLYVGCNLLPGSQQYHDWRV